jgi:glutathione synthase/RimK-type ligase-like ATP-grasp enzyme
MSANAPHVLVASTKLDVATDEVVQLLAERGVRVSRLNTEDYPFNSMLSTSIGGESGRIAVSFTSPPSPAVPLMGVTSVWYRRVRSAERPNGMTAGVYDFCLREARAALLGSVLALGGRCMNPPEKVWAAEYKPYQLATAQAVGLAVPETVITNDPDEVVAAFKRFGGQMIGKPCRTGYVDYGDGGHAIYTSQILEDHFSKVDAARLSPAIYQPLVPKLCDVRVTAVGDTLFVAEIDSQSDPAASVDWRRSVNPHLPHRVGSLPHEVEQQIRSLLRALGLSFGAVDLIRTPTNEYVFLEVNPSGQWLWVDDILGFGITASVADWLCGVRE